ITDQVAVRILLEGVISHRAVIPDIWDEIAVGVCRMSRRKGAKAIGLHADLARVGDWIDKQGGATKPARPRRLTGLASGPFVAAENVSWPPRVRMGQAHSRESQQFIGGCHINANSSTDVSDVLLKLLAIGDGDGCFTSRADSRHGHRHSPRRISHFD